MKQLRPQTRALFEGLRADLDVSPAAVDAAWGSFQGRLGARDRRRAAAWVSLAIAMAAAALLWTVSSLSPSWSAHPASEPGVYGQAVANGRAETPKVVTRDEEPGRPSSAVSPSTVSAADLANVPNPRPPAVDVGSRVPKAEQERKQMEASALADEVRLLDEAESAVHEGRFAQAQRLLEQHRQRFPQGVLAAERRLLSARLAERKKLEK